MEAVIGVQEVEQGQRYYSQHGQDKFIAETLFRGKRGGLFVEIGAYDGVSLSNTYHLEKYLGWKGACVEPVKHVFQELQKNRSCICINACVAEDEGVEDFYYVVGDHPMGTKYCSGLARHYPKPFVNIIDKEIVECGGSRQLIQSPCVRPETIFKKCSTNHIDYLSIDVEGAELAILKSIDLSKISIDVISVENLYFGESLREFLEPAGFKYIKKIGYDEIYRKA